MKALTRLQSTVLFQAAEHELVVKKFNERAKQMVLFGVVLAAALAAKNVQAQDRVLTPSNCATVGATVGGAIGVASGNSSVKHIVYGALGALGGAAAGNWLCSPKEQRMTQDSSYQAAAQYGMADRERSSGVLVERQPAKAPLSVSERQMLDEMSQAAMDAKYGWKLALYEVERARNSGQRMAMNSALEREAVARDNFDRTRDAFSLTVARLNAGAAGVEPRAVGRYIEISGSLLELNTNRAVSYQMLEERDMLLKQRSPAYNQEAERANRLRNG